MAMIFFNESYQAVHLNNFFLFHFDVDFVGSVCRL